VDERKPLPVSLHTASGLLVDSMKFSGFRSRCAMPCPCRYASPDANSTNALRQGLTLVQFSVQRKRLLWDEGCN